MYPVEIIHGATSGSRKLTCHVGALAFIGTAFKTIQYATVINGTGTIGVFSSLPPPISKDVEGKKS